jgi:hypothetical protein
MYLILNVYRDTVVLIYIYKSIVNGNKGTNLLILLYCLNAKLVTQKRQISYSLQRNIRQSHRQPQCTLKHVCKDRVLFVYLHVSLCG